MEQKYMKQTLFVIQELVSREMKRKYSRSKLGILWSVLNPLLSMTVLSLVFSTMFRKSIENYPVYYLTGFLIWSFFTTATNTAMTSLADNQALLLQVRLPREIFPFSRVCTAFMNFLYSLGAYVMILAVFRISLGISVLFFPLVMVLLFFFSLGVGYILSVLYVFFGDIRHLYSVFLTLLMYLSALFYPLELLPEGVQAFIRLNPIYQFIYAARSCVMYREIPSACLWVKMSLWSFLFYLAGIYIFRKAKTKITLKL